MKIAKYATTVAICLWLAGINVLASSVGKVELKYAVPRAYVAGGAHGYGAYVEIRACNAPALPGWSKTVYVEWADASGYYSGTELCTAGAINDEYTVYSCNFIESLYSLPIDFSVVTEVQTPMGTIEYREGGYSVGPDSDDSAVGGEGITLDDAEITLTRRDGMILSFDVGCECSIAVQGKTGIVGAQVWVDGVHTGYAPATYTGTLGNRWDSSYGGNDVEIWKFSLAELAVYSPNLLGNNGHTIELEITEAHLVATGELVPRFEIQTRSGGTWTLTVPGQTEIE